VPPTRANHVAPPGAAALDSFIAHTEASTGTELPRCIKDKFDPFAECGIVVRRLLRLRCGECGHAMLQAAGR
jgi:hypothetical protein